MIKKQKQNSIVLLVILILLMIGIGYAYLSSNLSITGAMAILGNTWDIHFENVVINENSVTIGTGNSAATINPSDNTELTYSVTLNKPGDFYEFTVDVKNYGTIDGMIESITSTLIINNGNPITIADDKSNLPAYLDYSITYSDDVAIEQNHELKAGRKETYKVRVEFKKDITASQLPSGAQNLNFSMTPNFIQSDENAVTREGSSSLSHGDETILYVGFQDNYLPGIAINSPLNTEIHNEIEKPENRQIQYFSDLEDAYAISTLNACEYYDCSNGWYVDIAIKLVVVNDIVTEEYVVFRQDGQDYFIRGGVNDADVHDENVQILHEAFGEENCTTYYSNYTCRKQIDDNPNVYNKVTIDIYGSAVVEWDSRYGANVTEEGVAYFAELS